MTIDDFDALMATGYVVANFPEAFSKWIGAVQSSPANYEALKWNRICRLGYFNHDSFSWAVDDMFNVQNLIDATAYTYLMTFQPSVGAPEQQILGTNVQ